MSPALRNSGARRPVAGALLALLVGLLLALGLAEVGLRLAGPALGSPRLPLAYDTEAIDRLALGDAYVTFDAEVGWVPTPNADRMGGDVRYRHNRDGLRAERVYEPGPPSGTRRIAAYGDSFTYCEEVELEECWTERLAEMLGRSEVLNFGAPGYSPDQAWLRYRRDGASWQPCAVLIGHLVENVNRVVNRFRAFYYPETGIPLGKPRFVPGADGRLALLPSPAGDPELLKDPGWVEANLGPSDAFYFPGTFVANPLDSLQLVNLTRTAIYRRSRGGAVEWTSAWAAQMYRPGGEPLEVLTDVLAGFAEQVRRDGATPVVVIFPWIAEITDRRDGAPKSYAPLLEALERRDVATVDLTDALGEQARRSSLGNLVVAHYRPLGNTVVARTLDRELPRLTRATCGRG